MCMCMCTRALALALGAVSGVSKEPSSSLGSAGTADASATHVLNTEGIIRGMLDLMDQQATDENTISSEDFHSNVYKPVRAKLVKVRTSLTILCPMV